MKPSDSQRRFGQVFDQVAEEYDEFRLGYPAALVDRAIERGCLEPGSRVLEVGCGTGKLTESLIDRGLLVDAVDPGPNMIAVARRRLGESDRVSFHLGLFEDAGLPERAFEGLFSATAFHWVDPTVGWAKAASHLKEGGLLALLAHQDLWDEESAARHDEFLELLRRYAPAVADRRRPPRELDAILAGVAERHANASEVWDWLIRDGGHHLAVEAAAPLFDEIEVASEVIPLEETADDQLAVLRTTSLYQRIEPARRPAFEEGHRLNVERHGATVRSSIVALLMTARRTTD